MRISFSAKILGLLFCSVLTVACVVSLIAWRLLSDHFDRSAQDELNGDIAAITALIESDMRLSSMVAKSQAARPSMEKAVAEKDAAAVKLLAKEAMQAGGMDFVTISDAAGVVLARGHSEQSGDSVIGQTNVKKALAGTPSVGLEPGTAVKFSLRAGHPVMKDGKVVGVITAGLNITQDHAFVDRVKRLFDNEATIFEGDTRVSTTILREGKRAVGTKMDNPAVLETVLKKGEAFRSRNTILGKDYNTAYWPIRNPEGQISGMLFIGKDRSVIAAASASIIRSMVVGTALVGALTLALGALFARAVIRPVHGIIALTRSVGLGNLNARAEGRYSAEMAELKNGIESMLGSLRDKIEEADQKSRLAAEEAKRAQAAVAEADAARHAAEAARREGMTQAAGRLEGVAEGVADLATRLSASVRQITDGTESQRGLVAETATAMEEMNATVLEVARNAASAADSAESAKRKAMEGAGVVRSSVTAIDEAGATAQTLAEQMRGLEGRATDIGRVLNVISDIADQTNLLALNAAIEAARAGDAGRGFAVVADEVRKLAEKTMNATKEVGDSIRAIQEEAGRSLQSVTAAVQAVNRATQLADASGGALTEIVALSDESAGRVLSIASASEQQSAASEEINRAIGEVSGIANRTAGDMRESAQSLERLTRMTQELRTIVEELKA